MVNMIILSFPRKKNEFINNNCNNNNPIPHKLIIFMASLLLIFLHAKYSTNCIDVIDINNKTVNIAFLFSKRIIMADITPNINVFNDTF